MRNRRFIAAAAAAVVATAGVLVWTLTGFLGSQAVLWLNDVGEMVAALVAAIACAFAAVRHRGRARLAWAVLGGSAFSWAMGEAAWCWYELIRNDAVPFPGLPDVGYLGAVPLAVVAILAFPGGSRSTLSRVNAILDGLIIAASLLSISWVLVLRTVYEAGADTTLAQVLGLAYPASDVVLATMVISLAIRSSRATRNRYLLLAGGLLCTALADSAFAYLTASGNYGAGSPLDTAWFGGYLLIALGALHAAQAPDRGEASEPHRSRLRLALPYVPMVVAAIMAVDEELAGDGLDRFLFLVLMTLVGLVVTRQFLTLIDNLSLVRRLGTRERQLEFQAFHDGLTGLANRMLFRRHLDELLEGGHHSGRGAVVFIDLDDFKNVNDSLGHDAGDRLLQIVARRLRDAVRSTDVAARLGGDEFALLLRSTDGVTDVMHVAERVLSQVRAPYDLGEHSVRVQATIGIAMVEPGGATSDELLRRADIAMYMGKGRGKDMLSLYESSFQEAVMTSLARRIEVESAAARGEFSLQYQPVVEVATQRIVGVEALMRWDHPSRGRLLPVDFMSELENSDLILAVGGWAVEEACRQVASWRSTLAPDLGVAVNVSTRQLVHADLPDKVRAALALTGLPPSALTVEVTETAVASDPQKSAAILRSLRRLGARIALDDFGTGFSSLTHLRHFPVDIIKIDRSFTSGLTAAPPGPALTEALIRLGRALGVTVIAEGVEKQGEHDALRALGCEQAQGYFYGRPIPAAAMAELLGQVRGPAGAVERRWQRSGGLQPGTAPG